ncbi:uncharacterized protein LOC116850637 [Odontomachus brunneus]|uniref:uncharacterized protein LOC116850637 n=1 Tax=Odontomachus brunneus TaxID=486640 RepID=UPI0013F2A661|nr:uncharacterized protein LOC116850637 [Odontomachus brunneus]XP_032685036.1 uncharacterized protein LOC116850637 [Odontomachus brunneus]
MRPKAIRYKKNIGRLNSKGLYNNTDTNNNAMSSDHTDVLENEDSDSFEDVSDDEDDNEIHNKLKKARARKNKSEIRKLEMAKKKLIALFRNRNLSAWEMAKQVSAVYNKATMKPEKKVHNTSLRRNI